MTKDEWYWLLVEFTVENPMLGKLPFRFLDALAESLANWQSAQQSVQRIGLYCAACGSELGENDTCPRMCSQDTPNR